MKGANDNLDIKRILLLDSDPERNSVLNRGLEESGYEVVARLVEGYDLLVQVESLDPEVVVIGIDIPDVRILEQLALMNKRCARPVIMFAEKEGPTLVDKVVASGVNAFVVNDIQPHRLNSIITIAMARFRANQALRDELEEAKTKLAQRKTIDRAKGLLMERQNISEDQAYQSLRKMAMDRGKPLAVVADSIIDVFTMLEPSS